MAGGMISGERNFGTAPGFRVQPGIAAAFAIGMPKSL